MSAGIQPELTATPERIYVEIRERAPTHLWITDIRTVHREDGLNAALSVDGKPAG